VFQLLSFGLGMFLMFICAMIYGVFRDLRFVKRLNRFQKQNDDLNRLLKRTHEMVDEIKDKLSV